LAAEGPGCYAFENFTAPLFRGPYKAPNVNQTPEVRRFRTVIRQGAKGDPNFAGYLRVVSWGCGSNCHLFALVDMKTGKVSIVPIEAGLGAEFQANSRLLIADSPRMIKESGVSSDLFRTMYYVWDEDAKTLQTLPACQ